MQAAFYSNLCLKGFANHNIYYNHNGNLRSEAWATSRRAIPKNLATSVYYIKRRS